MKITEIMVGVRRLIALAKYENVTYEVQAKVSLGENDNADEVYKETLAFCQHKILAEMERMAAGVNPAAPTKTAHAEVSKS